MTKPQVYAKVVEVLKQNIRDIIGAATHITDELISRLDSGPDAEWELDGEEAQDLELAFDILIDGEHAEGLCTLGEIQEYVWELLLPDPDPSPMLRRFLFTT